MPNNRKVHLLPQIVKNIEPGSIVNTDTLSSYRTVAALGYTHVTVNHNMAEYVRGDIHTNRIEGFWSHLKRSLLSTHISVSPQHLHSYLGEFSFRYNLRKDPTEMFSQMLQHVSIPTSSSEK